MRFTPGFFTYSIAGIILVLFSIRTFRVYRAEQWELLKLIAQGTGVVGLALILYGISHGTPTGVILTLIYPIADICLLTGIFLIMRFPLNYWAGVLKAPAPFRVLRYLLLGLIVGSLGINVMLLIFGIRPSPTLNHYGIVNPHAPFWYDSIKMALIALVGLSSGASMLHNAKTEHSKRSLRLGVGMVIMGIGGSLPTFPVTPTLVDIGVGIMTVGAGFLLIGLFTRNQPPPAQAPPLPFNK